MVRALLIDLDDTLYDERSYVLSGFRVVAAEIARRFAADPEALFAAMVVELGANGRGRVFDVALASAGVSAGQDLIEDLVELYRSHRPQIALWPGVPEALADLRRDYRLALITDGLAMMQRRKIEALGVAAMVDETLICWEHDAPKPDPACYLEALRRLGSASGDAVVIGDNPAHDMAAALAISARSVRVLSGRFAGQPDGAFPADARVPGFAEVPSLLRSQMFGVNCERA